MRSAVQRHESQLHKRVEGLRRFNTATPPPGSPFALPAEASPGLAPPASPVALTDEVGAGVAPAAVQPERADRQGDGRSESPGDLDMAAVGDGAAGGGSGTAIPA